MQSRGITLAMVGVVMLLWFTPSQMHYDPELDGPRAGANPLRTVGGEATDLDSTLLLC